MDSASVNPNKLKVRISDSAVVWLFASTVIFCGSKPLKVKRPLLPVPLYYVVSHGGYGALV